MRQCGDLDGITIGPVKISHLLFADDLVLFGTSQESLQTSLDKFTSACVDADMKINTSKTEVMVLSRQATDCIIKVNGAQLRQVNEFKYLGVMFSSDGRQDKEIDRRINQAGAAASELWKTVVANVKMSQQTKMAIYKTLFRAILTYGSETWILEERTRSKIQAAEMRFLRKIAGKTRHDRIRNDTIRESLNVESLILTVEKSQMRWLGNVLRMGPDRIAGQMLHANPTTRRPPGRPPTRWLDQVTRFCERASVPTDRLQATANDVTGWLHLTADLPSRP